MPRSPSDTLRHGDDARSGYCELARGFDGLDEGGSARGRGTPPISGPTMPRCRAHCRVVPTRSANCRHRMWPGLGGGMWRGTLGAKSRLNVHLLRCGR